MREALLWHREDDKVRCELCPHHCLIAEGRHGVCTVRKNVGGRLVALTYGLVSSVAVDPVEKKPVFHYRPGTLTLSVGSVGCNMRCAHCQNWSISREKPFGGRIGLDELPPADVARLAVEHRCEGVAFTYNEPSIWAEYVLDASRAAKEAGLYTVMVTNGYITAEGLDLIGEVVDVWRVDVKGLRPETYRELCRVPSVAPVYEQAERAKKRWGMHVEVVTNVVPGQNDDEESLRGIARWMREALGEDTPWHVTRFYPHLEMSNEQPTPLATLRRAREIGAEEGLHFVFLGNVPEPGGEDTVCPQCGNLAVRRSGFDVTSTSLEGGSCARCGRDLGIVSAAPAASGRRSRGDA